MSSIYLLKPHEKAKIGDVISVPFSIGIDLIKRGIGRYWNGGETLQAVPPPAPAAVAPVEVKSAPAEPPAIHAETHSKSEPVKTKGGKS